MHLQTFLFEMGVRAAMDGGGKLLCVNLANQNL